MAWWAVRWQLRCLGVDARRLTAATPDIDDAISGFIIGGGNDIDPGIYGGDVSASPNVDPLRDEFELRVLDNADRRGTPVLGICRGAQLINVHAGGTLISDLSRHRVLTSNKGTLLPRKAVDLVAGSRVADWIGGTRTRVNSLHHQAVRRSGEGLEVTARDRDGIAQAIERTLYPARIGVQWHPEYLPQRADQRRLFARFVETCRNAQAR